MNALSFIVMSLLLLGLPLAGATLAGKPIAQYLQFPPLTHYVEHAPFSWPVFVGLALFTAAVLAPFVRRIAVMRAGTTDTLPTAYSPQCNGSVTEGRYVGRELVSSPKVARTQGPALRVAGPLPRHWPIFPRPAACSLQPAPFPWWGWLGLAAGVIAWVLAWTRFRWFTPLQPFTFSPLWFCYIVVVNALLYRRTGRCMLKDRPAYTALLFAASAAFWWFFEYLNRFVQNWYYVGTGQLSPLQYLVFATLPFSTVLPAVMGTYELLASFPRLGAGLDGFAPIDVRRPRLAAALALAAADAGLAGIGIWPNALFPVLWLSPFCIIASLLALRGQPTLLSAVRAGNWRRICLLALAALICGFFWEMWNFRSMARWIYDVPFVNRFHVFEMPILGYAGYLPFGLECGLVADLSAEWLAQRTQASGTWKRRAARMLLTSLLFVAGVSYLPYLWCSRGAAAWYRGDPATQQKLARGLEYWISRPLSRGDFSTGSRQFDGEWLFGTYLMAGLGFCQTAIEHPEWRARHAALAAACIERLLSPEVRAFDRESWQNDPLESLDTSSAHAAYLGYLNLLLGLHRQLATDSPYAALNDRITAALVRRIEQSPIAMLESYPGEVYPVDNCAVAASIAVHARATGTDRSEFLNRWSRTLRGKYVDPRTGLLYQAASSRNGEPIDDGRGSGTCLGLYFLSFADPSLSLDLYRAARKELAGTVFGFGGVREYPQGSAAQVRDIDSGPVAFGYGLSATGFMIAGSRIHRDPDWFTRLYATAYAFGAPLETEGRLNFVTGASLGDAILFAMLTANPAPAPLRGEEAAP